MEDLGLRPAKEEDASRLLEIVRAAYGKYIERIGREPRPMTEDYAEVMRNFDVTVAASGGEIVGMAAIGPDEEGFIVDNVAVDPAHHGEGIGRALLVHAEDEARRAGNESIYLYTHEAMTQNLALYEKIGYVEYDRRPIAKPGNVVFMRKPLLDRQAELA